MKKIAILLALVMALSCCLLMLAACGESDDASSPADTSSAATSSEGTSSAATSSEKEESSVTSEAESSEEASSEPTEESSEPTEESSEEPVDDETPDATPNPDGKNLAAGKSYTKSQLFQQGESTDDAGNKTWGWVDGIDPSYPDTGDKELTDGKFAADDSTYSGEEWMGFHSGCPDYASNGYAYFTVDLGDVYALSKLVVYVGTTNLTGGIGAPATVEFLVSDDGKTFTSVGTISPTDDPSSSVQAVALDCNVTGQYVQVRMTAANWMFVCEFEAY